LEANIDYSYSDFKVDYFLTLSKNALIYPMIASINSPLFAKLIIYTIFGLQLSLISYLLIATLLTQMWINQKEKRLALERQILVVNIILHWYFTFYALFFMMMAATSLSAITCSKRGLF
jgi:hypothetical protein